MWFKLPTKNLRVKENPSLFWNSWNDTVLISTDLAFLVIIVFYPILEWMLLHWIQILLVIYFKGNISTLDIHCTDYVVIKLLYPQVISKSVCKGNLTDFYLSM